MTDQLRHRLAAAIDDAATPVTAAEVMRSSELDVSSRPSGSGRAQWLGAAVAAAMVVLAVAGAATWSRSGSSPTRDVATSGSVAVTTASDATAIDTSRCRNVATTGGCPATTQQAERTLGIALPDPGGIPDGWVPVPSRTAIRTWSASARTPQTVDYNQVWAPAGEDLDSPGSVPAYLQLRRRAALPGESAMLTGVRVDLRNGQAATLDGTSLVWSRHGVTTRLGGYGIDMATLEAIAATLP